MSGLASSSWSRTSGDLGEPCALHLRALESEACSFSVVHFFRAPPLAQAGDSMAREITLSLPFQSSKGWSDGPEVARGSGQMCTTEEESRSDRKRGSFVGL